LPAPRFPLDGKITGDASEPMANGYMVPVAWSCDVAFMRWIAPYDEVEALLLSEED
jgi:hypothetical protein